MQEIAKDSYFCKIRLGQKVEIRDKSDTGGGNPPNGVFEGIYKSYYVYILNFAYSFVMDRAAAEDIAQDVFWKLWRRPSWLPQPDDARHYLLRLAKNECLNYLKHKGVEDHNKQKLVEALLFSETSGWSRDDEEAQARVRKCLDMLPPKQREVLTLRYFEGLKYTEIALRLGISPETVETHIKRAFRFFRNNLPTIMSIVLFYDMTDF